MNFEENFHDVFLSLPFGFLSRRLFRLICRKFGKFRNLFLFFFDELD